MENRHMIEKAVKHFTSQIKENGPSDTAAWEYAAHLNSALNARSYEEAVEILEDAIGASIDMASFK